MGINAPSVMSSDDTIWLYTITFTNNTQDVIDVMVQARQKDGQAIAYLKPNWVPGERRVFELFICSNMEAYTISCFNPAYPEGEQLIFFFPGEGQEMTPLRASQMNPTDRFMCEDSWTISEG